MATIKSLKADVRVLALCPVTLTKGLCLKCQLFNSLRWPLYLINSVDNTKLPCYTLPPTQHHSFCRKLPPLFIWYGWDLPSEQVSKLFYTVASKQGFSPVIKFVVPSNSCQKYLWDLTVYTHTLVYIFLILFSIHSLRCWLGEFV